ncbi:ribonuclease J, partial [Clostridium saudiense]|nr:ribonuclease J [Clostridium saudiense]
YKDIEDIHVSGHACEEELKLIHSIVRPKFFMPVHGEYKHLRKHSLIAQQLGLKKENAFILENGDVLELTRKTARINGKVQVGNVLVDGVGIGDIGNIVLRDRKVLSNDGIINIVIALEKESKEILCGPDIVTRGFVYVRESEELVAEIREIAVRSLQYCIDNRILKW